MGAYLRNDKDGVEEDLERMLTLFPRIRERLTQQGGTLSGGEQQMLAMARALMSRPKLLLMDEPSMGLAPVLVEQNFELIKQVNEGGVTVFMVEQNANMALSHRRPRLCTPDRQNSAGGHGGAAAPERELAQSLLRKVIMLRDHFPIFETKTYLNSCSKGALSLEVKRAYQAYLDDWETLGSPWELWVGKLEETRAAFAKLINAKPDEIAVTTSVSAAVEFVGERARLRRRAKPGGSERFRVSDGGADLARAGEAQCAGRPRSGRRRG